MTAIKRFFFYFKICDAKKQRKKKSWKPKSNWTKKKFVSNSYSQISHYSPRKRNKRRLVCCDFLIQQQRVRSFELWRVYYEKREKTTRKRNKRKCFQTKPTTLTVTRQPGRLYVCECVSMWIKVMNLNVCFFPQIGFFTECHRNQHK